VNALKGKKRGVSTGVFDVTRDGKGANVSKHGHQKPLPFNLYSHLIAFRQKDLRKRRCAAWNYFSCLRNLNWERKLMLLFDNS